MRTGGARDGDVADAGAVFKDVWVVNEEGGLIVGLGGLGGAAPRMAPRVAAAAVGGEPAEPGGGRFLLAGAAMWSGWRRRRGWGGPGCCGGPAGRRCRGKSRSCRCWRDACGRWAWQADEPGTPLDEQIRLELG